MVLITYQCKGEIGQALARNAIDWFKDVNYKSEYYKPGPMYFILNVVNIPSYEGNEISEIVNRNSTI